MGIYWDDTAMEAMTSISHKQVDDLLIKNGDFPIYVELPEGRHGLNTIQPWWNQTQRRSTGCWFLLNVLLHSAPQAGHVVNL